jgi:formiminotetrahydrofolate cyclodeaminase
MGAALAGMVATLTLSREKFAAVHDAVRPIGEAAAAAREELLALAREDAEAYDEVVAARRLPKETEEQKRARSKSITEATRRAAEVPMQTASVAVRMLEALPELVEKGNPSAASDAGAAALLLEAAAEAALLNVGINLSGAGDVQFVSRMQRETSDLQVEAQRLRSHVLAAVRKRF